MCAYVSLCSNKDSRVHGFAGAVWLIHQSSQAAKTLLSLV